ncbi:MAG: DUF4330 domain-containing protein [Clostridiales bacterium]|jgi:hypothetical protein|nr:DUF4330 domain-containing protein [Clostridiales bacterium]
MAEHKYKFNWLDWVIVSVVILAIIGGAWYFLKPKAQQNVASTSDITFQFQTKGASMQVAQSYKPGLKVIFGEKRADVGEIIDAKIYPQRDDLEDTLNGAWKTSIIPDFYVAVLTIKMPVTETASAFAGAGENVTIGKQTIIEGKGFATEGYVIGINDITQPQLDDPINTATRSGDMPDEDSFTTTQGGAQ